MKANAWDGFLRAIDTEPQPVTTLGGVSGYPHALLAAGVDHIRRRLVIVSPETDPRMVAMAQADIQAADPSIHVISIRPVAFNFASFFNTVAAIPDQDELKDDVKESLHVQFAEKLSLLTPFVETGQNPEDTLRSLSGMVQTLMRQLITTDLPAMTDEENAAAQRVTRANTLALPAADLLAADRELGICPIPSVKR